MKNKIRVIFQSIILALIGYVALRPVFDSSYTPDFEAYCPMGGLSSIMSKLNMGNMSCSMNEVQVLLGVGLIVGVILFGKLFCSYICPIGSITEWLGKIGDKLKIRMDMPEFLDRPFRVFKYVLLFITIYFTMTSSELFCKEYDPYFLVVNWFDNPDIAMYLAIPAFIITIVGAIVFRLFWCKYLCPLGALSNIFYNVVPVAAVILLFVIANALGAGLGYVWLIGGIVLVGMVTEVFFKRSFFLPFTKITRNTDTCTDCGLCEAKCPQGIELTKYETVNHIDCNLCTDCVHSCPVKQSLEINKTKTTKYLAPVVTVLLIAISLGFSSYLEFTTISERWNNFDKLENVEVYKQSDLKNIKCFGSAASLKRQIEGIKGIYGIDAYAASQSVEIYFNPKEISALKVRESIFKPTKQKVRIIKGAKYDSLAVWEIGIDKLFDNVDYSNLLYALRTNEGIKGFETIFGEPVKTKIYYDGSATNPEKINKAILTEEIEIKKRGGEILKRDLSFELNEEGRDLGSLSLRDYRKNMFKEYSRGFNKFDKQNIEDLSVLVYPMPESSNFLVYRKMSYMVSHLSNNDNVFKFETKYDDQPMAYVFFNADSMSVTDLQELISSPKLKISFSNGTKKEVDNFFKSKPDGEVKKATDLKK